MVEGYSRAHIRSDQVRRDALSSGRAAQAALFDDAQDTAKQVARRAALVVFSLRNLSSMRPLVLLTALLAGYLTAGQDINTAFQTACQKAQIILAASPTSRDLALLENLSVIRS